MLRGNSISNCQNAQKHIISLLIKGLIVKAFTPFYSKKIDLIYTLLRHHILNPIEVKNFSEISKFLQQIGIISDSISAKF